jgi:hypothetical protein
MKDNLGQNSELTSKFEKHIKALRKLMETAKILGDIAEYFLTYLAEDREFIKNSVVIEEPPEMLLSVIRKISENIFSNKPEIQFTMLLRFPESDLIHGHVVINHYMVNIIFFEEIGMGLFIITLLDGHTHFFRFSTVVIKDSMGLPYLGTVSV